MMKKLTRNYRNETIVDFQGKRKKQVKDSEFAIIATMIVFTVATIIYFLITKIF
jgi:hypothetical protein